MKNVISVRDLEEMVRQGQDVLSLPAETILTPSARDFLREVENGAGRKGAAAGANVIPAAGGKPQPPAKPLSSKSAKSE